MLEVADIFRLHGAAFCARFGHGMLPSQARVMQDIAACRTAYFGGHLKQCDQCGEKVYPAGRDHSCRNRHCPKCHGKQTTRWLSKQGAGLLPCSYFLLTFTLPGPLRPLARRHQKKVYGLLMRSPMTPSLLLRPCALSCRPAAGVFACPCVYYHVSGRFVEATSPSQSAPRVVSSLQSHSSLRNTG